MSHRNPIEGDLNEPVEARISGEAMAVAHSDREGWMLLRVESCRFAGPAGASLKVAPGAELAVRFNPQAGEPREGERMSVSARIMKSREGPVIVAQSIEEER